MLQQLKNHVLVQTFRELKGNPKWSICTEPLWFIPYSLFIPFQTLYMRKLGLSSVEIGTTVTVGFILQMFFAFVFFLPCVPETYPGWKKVLDKI